MNFRVTRGGFLGQEVKFIVFVVFFGFVVKVLAMVFLTKPWVYLTNGGQWVTTKIKRGI